MFFDELFLGLSIVQCGAASITRGRFLDMAAGRVEKTDERTKDAVSEQPLQNWCIEISGSNKRPRTLAGELVATLLYDLAVKIDVLITPLHEFAFFESRHDLIEPRAAPVDVFLFKLLSKLSARDLFRTKGIQHSQLEV